MDWTEKTWKRKLLRSQNKGEKNETGYGTLWTGIDCNGYICITGRYSGLSFKNRRNCCDSVSDFTDKLLYKNVWFGTVKKLTRTVREGKGSNLFLHLYKKERREA